MQSQYGFRSQAAAPALEYVGVGRRVIKLDGSPISWDKSIVRNLLHIFDHLPYATPYLLIWT